MESESEESHQNGCDQSESIPAQTNENESEESLQEIQEMVVNRKKGEQTLH